jgi:hypothetical protein
MIDPTLEKQVAHHPFGVCRKIFCIFLIFFMNFDGLDLFLAKRHCQAMDIVTRKHAICIDGLIIIG